MLTIEEVFQIIYELAQQGSLSSHFNSEKDTELQDEYLRQQEALAQFHDFTTNFATDFITQLR